MSSSAAPSRFAVTPEPPYLIVTFASQRIIGEDDGYGEIAVQMGELAAETRTRHLASRTVNEASIHAWKREVDHLVAQKLEPEVVKLSRAYRS